MFLKRTSEASDDESSIVLALFNKKNNLGRRHPAVGLQIDFGTARTSLRRVNLADVEEFASGLPIWQRMKRALASGPRTLVDLADEFGATNENRDKLITNMEREVRRKKVSGQQVFVRLTTGTPGGVHRIALASDRVDAA